MNWWCCNCSRITELDRHGRCCFCESEQIAPQRDVPLMPQPSSFDIQFLRELCVKASKERI